MLEFEIIASDNDGAAGADAGALRFVVIGEQLQAGIAADQIGDDLKASLARGRDGQQTDEIKITADEVQELNESQAASYKPAAKTVPTSETAEKLYINLLTKNDEQTLLSLKKTIDNHQGSTQVILVLGDPQTKQAIRLPGGIDKADSALNELGELVGPENLVLKT